MYKSPTIKQAKLFHDEFCTYLRNVGATELEHIERTKGNLGLPERTIFNIETKAGPLNITVMDDWLACKFEDVKKAKSIIAHDWNSRLNPCSGKWNFHYSKDNSIIDCLNNFMWELNNIL